jgi:hypothetical protein
VECLRASSQTFVPVLVEDEGRVDLSNRPGASYPPGGMTISFARQQFPPAIIRHAVWLYVRFTLSYRDVEDMLAERGLDVSYETVRR